MQNCTTMSGTFLGFITRFGVKKVFPKAQSCSGLSIFTSKDEAANREVGKVVAVADSSPHKVDMMMDKNIDTDYRNNDNNPSL